MKILAVGDIVGESGVRKLKELLPKIKREENIDFVITNGENSAGGMGITEKNFKDIIEAGTNVITMGNHTWGKKDIFKFIDDPQILRPANYPKGVVGKGYSIYKCKNKKIAVMNLLGRTNMGILTENPFLEADNIINKVRNEVDYIILDFHAEATAEKIAMREYLEGRVNIIFGTHTHVQTADEEITKSGMGYISDLGMTGPKDSVIGMDKRASIKRFVTTLPEKYRIAEGESKFNGCIFEIDDETGRIQNILRRNM